MADISEPRSASTVVLLRDGKTGLETLMLKRNKALQFAGGFWVFPGGAIDKDEVEKAGGDMNEAARLAAAREAEEESGLRPQLENMVQLSHWTTPVAEPRRFYTWIYAAPVASDDEVQIDGGEIHDSNWLGVSEAVAAHEAGDLNVLPPTYITLCNLSRYSTVSDMVTAEQSIPPDEVFPVFASVNEQMVVMFRGDAGYDSGDGGGGGAQHRAIYDGTRWVYVHEGVDPAYRSLIGD